MQEKNKISIFAATMMNMNIMIGAAIFIGPSMMAIKGGNLSFLGWIAIALLFFPVVWSIIQVSKYYPQATSFFSFSKSLGITVTFISGWSYFLGFLCAIPIQIVGLSEVLHTQFKLNFVQNHPILFYAITIAFLTSLSVFSLKIISKFQNSLTIFKLLPIIFVIILIPFYWNSELQINLSNISIVRYTLPFTLFGYWGFEACTNIISSIKGGRKSATIAILSAFFTVTTVYSIFHFGLLNIMGSQNLANYGVPAFVYYLNIKSPIILNLLNAILSSVIATAYLSAAFGVFISNSSIFQNLAKEGYLIFSSFISKSTKNDRPFNALLIKALLIFLILVFVNNKIILTSICNTGLITAFLITIISLFVLQLRNKDYKQLFMTILAFISSGILIAYNWFNLGANNIIRLKYISPLIIMIIIGLIMFKIKSKKRQKLILKNGNQ